MQVERLITLQVIMGKTTIDEISRLRFGIRQIGLDRTRNALNMLKLYGILDQKQETISLRASWFSEAVKCYGSIEQQIAQLEVPDQ